MQTEMSFLIDTNVIITAEPFSGEIEPRQRDVSTFLRLTSRHGHKVYVHPASYDDLSQTTDPVHRSQNLAAYQKYVPLAEVAVPAEVSALFPENPKANDLRDSRILAALHAGAVDFLVTNDERLLRRAKALGREPNVLRVSEAASQLEAWHPDAPPPPPQVDRVEAYELDLNQSVFDGLREDYEDFDGWIAKVKKDAVNRQCWIIRSNDGVYDALAIVKTRDEHPTRKAVHAIKLSTFKVADHAAGRRLGELLLKTVLRWASQEPGRPGELFVEVKAKQERLLEFLTDFGFAPVGNKTDDELIYMKRLDPTPGGPLSGLEHHVRYGPPALASGQPIYVIPITPQWYEDLFPDALYMGAAGQTVLPGTAAGIGPHGNALRKAYLCRSQTKAIPEGSTLLFYRSQGTSKGDGAVVAVGVAEKSLRTSDPTETISLSFKRTVFSSDAVARLHQDGKSVLTILFRHDRFIEPPWSLPELVSRRVVTTWPQSIVRVKDSEGIEWVEQELSAWP